MKNSQKNKQFRKVRKFRQIRDELILIGLVCLLLGSFKFACYYETHYERVGVITKIAKDGTVTFKDTTGNVWDFNDGKFYKVGQTVSVTMNNNLTDNTIEDDRVEDVRVIAK